MKLNLGCGTKAKAGFINVDIRPLSRVNLVCDVSRLCFKQDSVDEIVAESVLEHCTRSSFLPALREWVAVLRPGGKLTILCPNLRLLATMYLSNIISTSRFVRQIYGAQDYSENTHRCGFDPEYLKEVLVGIGIKDIVVLSKDHNSNNFILQGTKHG